ncbi:MAG: hypothetical protein K6E75_03565 [Lachnospiraceae bacterium]|nr:hypothetical protein [Lachnospiraceae bacterium]
MILKYKNTDIAGSVDLEYYIHESNAEQKADILKLCFRDPNRLWPKWNPQLGDKLQLKEGSENTGVMYVRKNRPEGAYFYIEASSLPLGVEIERSKAWQGITFRQIGQDIAQRYGLDFSSYGAPDYKYKTLTQQNINDLRFYENLCVLQGCAFLVYNGNLIVYQETYLEEKTEAAAYNLTANNMLRIRREQKYDGCAISNGDMSYKYVKTDGKLIANKKINQFIASRGEAEVIAKNMLKYLNKNKVAGEFYIAPIAGELAAGSVIRIESEDGYKGKVFVSRIRHDSKIGRSKVFFREIQKYG